MLGAEQRDSNQNYNKRFHSYSQVFPKAISLWDERGIYRVSWIPQGLRRFYGHPFNSLAASTAK